MFDFKCLETCLAVHQCTPIHIGGEALGMKYLLKFGLDWRAVKQALAWMHISRILGVAQGEGANQTTIYYDDVYQLHPNDFISSLFVSLLPPQ